MQRNKVYLRGAVTKEVNLLKAFIEDALQAVCFIPATREDIKWDFAAYGKRKAIIRKFLAKDVDKFSTKFMFLISTLSRTNCRINVK